MSRRGDISWTPELIARLKHMVSQKISDSKIAYEMGVSKGCISGARFRFGIKTVNGLHSVNSPPADFLDIAPALNLRACATHYGAAPSTAKAWYEHFGITPALRVYVKAEKPAKPPEPQRKGHHPYTRAFSTMQAMRAPERASTIASRAQFAIQRHMPCFRAKTAYPNAPDDQWVVGGTRLTESEMIQKAERYGFKVAA